MVLLWLGFNWRLRGRGGEDETIRGGVSSRINSKFKESTAGGGFGASRKAVRMGEKQEDSVWVGYRQLCGLTVRTSALGKSVESVKQCTKSHTEWAPRMSCHTEANTQSTVETTSEFNQRDCTKFNSS